MSYESGDSMKFYMPTKVYCERDCVRNHAGELAALGSRAMIVTGRHSSRVNGSLDDVTEALDGQHTPWVIYDDIEENPSIETVMKATSFGIAQGVDFVIGLGGGSPMDAAKAIAMMIAHPELDASVLYRDVALDALPVAAIPTTAGTGSEVTPWAILTIHNKHTKKSMSHQVFPTLALWDGRYLRHLSRKGRVSTAVDTLAHLVESRMVARADAMTSVFSEAGLRLWGQFRQHLLDDTMTDADDAAMIQACLMGGIAITHTSTGLPHALSYKLTYELGTAHGTACGYTLGGFVRYYPDETLKNKVLRAAGFENAEEFCAYLDALIGKPALPEGLWEANMAEVLGNSGKMATYPFEMNREIMNKYLG